MFGRLARCGMWHRHHLTCVGLSKRLYDAGAEGRTCNLRLCDSVMARTTIRYRRSAATFYRVDRTNRPRAQVRCFSCVSVDDDGSLAVIRVLSLPRGTT